MNPLLKGWCILQNSPKSFYLMGKVYGNWKFNDGDSVHTSTIKDMKRNDSDNGYIVSTRNTTYSCSDSDIDKNQSMFNLEDVANIVSILSEGIY